MNKRLILFTVLVLVAVLLLWGERAVGGARSTSDAEYFSEEAVEASLLTPTQRREASPRDASLPLPPPTSMTTTSGTSFVAAQPQNGTELPQHVDQGSSECRSVVTEEVITDWRNKRRVVCDDPATGIHIEEFVQDRFEYKPQLFVLQNIDIPSIFHNGYMEQPCPVGTYFEEESSNDVQHWAKGEAARDAYVNRKIRVVDDRIIFRLKRFDPYNPYEAFHSYVNTYFLIKVLQLNQSELQFAFFDNHPKAPNDELIWSSFNYGRFPLLFPGRVDGGFGNEPLRVRKLIRASSAGTSIICSNRGPLHGRASNHDCKSAIFREAVGWMRNNFASVISFSLVRPNPKINVVWVSRKPYVREVGLFHVSRMVNNEDGLIAELQLSLGSGFNVTAVDLARLAANQCIELMSNSDILMGVHGAGLIWSSFLPRHGGIIEIFGGDRGPGERHYHNVAKLADIHYRQTHLSGGLSWSQVDVVNLAKIIKDIPLHRLEAEP